MIAGRALDEERRHFERRQAVVPRPAENAKHVVLPERDPARLDSAARAPLVRKP